ncbi:RNA 2',3'-cyclic phosphodiesterase [Halopenitus persicus]|uniref:RNA 2',3'-cyclic phosphodiesterase n=1 Tax=Halopenitus persicus TaxID=1048396 RepID=A0A1H3LWJ7_9EURY|nr:RNA 2',3'-cyclic phosphodiesterase [Halopenitus persicus]QHS18107.1 RNA 2',3'-cyclic phosphodiesterase [haloarchaeon 3A1-DGR]SDY68165.1 2'-5' RNA ligase [Halopenitus persicus]
MRAFFAVDLPTDLADRIAEVQETLRGAEGLRFTDPEQAHVTLEFLGDVPEQPEDGSETDVDAVNEANVDAVIEAGREAVQEADVEPFTASVRGLGAFPSTEYIRVVWAGIGDGTAELTRLQAAIESRTTALGYEPDDHEFTPHVTLARMDDARGKGIVQEAIRDAAADVGSFTVEAVRLKRSTPTDSGPVYETVESFPLSS